MEENSSWKHFSSRASRRSGPWLKSMSSAATSAHAGPATRGLSLSCCDLEDSINYLVVIFPCKVQEPAWPEVIVIASLTPFCCTEACSFISAALQNNLSCPWRFQNSGPGWCEGLISLLGAGQLLFRAVLFVFQKDKTVGGASQHMSSFAGSSASPLTLIFWDGFWSSSFYSTPSQLSLLS